MVVAAAAGETQISGAHTTNSSLKTNKCRSIRKSSYYILASNPALNLKGKTRLVILIKLIPSSHRHSTAPPMVADAARHEMRRAES